jgi:hypothetical protein
MRSTFAALALASFCLAWSGAGSAAPDDTLSALYDRVAADVRAGQPLRVLVHVALCDNDSQGIVPVKNRRICDGNAPEQNIYWRTDGGLAHVLKTRGYRQLEYTQADAGPVSIRARWEARLPAGGALRARGVATPVRVEVTGLAYRGAEIRRAMLDFVLRVHDAGAADQVGNPHVVGYIGHNYFLDIRDRADFTRAAQARSAPALGVFALSCLGDRYGIRDAIRNPNARVLVLNRDLTYPGAFTVHGIVEGLTRGEDARGVHRQAALRFAEGRHKPLGTMLRAFAYGP